MLTAQRSNPTDVKVIVLLQLEIPWRLNVVLNCLVTSIDEAPRVKDFNRTGGLHSRDENALLRAVKSGQTSAFNELWQPHSSGLLQTIYRITRNREDAEDALQGALLNAFVHLHTSTADRAFGRGSHALRSIPR